jgi:hypothetical protein
MRNVWGLLNCGVFRRTSVVRLLGRLHPPADLGPASDILEPPRNHENGQLLYLDHASTNQSKSYFGKLSLGMLGFYALASGEPLYGFLIAIICGWAVAYPELFRYNHDFVSRLDLLPHLRAIQVEKHCFWGGRRVVNVPIEEFVLV